MLVLVLLKMEYYIGRGVHKFIKQQHGDAMTAQPKPYARVLVKTKIKGLASLFTIFGMVYVSISCIKYL